MHCSSHICVRLLFGKELIFDHAEYNETCTKVKTYKEHTKFKKTNRAY